MKTTQLLASAAVVAALMFPSLARAGGATSTPIQSSPIVVSPDDKTVAVCNPDNASITLLDATTLKVLREVKTGPDPSSLTFSPDGKFLYVAHAAAGTVTPVDLTSRRALRPVVLGGEPSALLFTPNGSPRSTPSAATPTRPARRSPRSSRS